MRRASYCAGAAPTEALKKDLDVPVQAFILDMRDRSHG